MGEITLHSLSSRIDRVEGKIDGLADRINDLTVVVGRSFAYMQERSEAFEKETRDGFNRLDKRLEVVEGKANTILFEVRDHNKRLCALEAR